MTVLVAIDTDPNEDAEQVRQHVERYALKGRFAVAPAGMTAALVDQFGPTVVSPPTAPVILISADQSEARLLKRGVKTAEELREIIEESAK